MTEPITIVTVKQECWLRGRKLEPGEIIFGEEADLLIGDEYVVREPFERLLAQGKVSVRWE